MKVPEKHREIAHAWVDGAEIEWLNNRERWEPKTLDHWNEHTQYRVKPAIPDSIDWSHVAEKYVAMARGKHGDVDLCTKIPEPDTCFWQSDGEFTNALGFKSLKIGTIDWQDSLVLRPTEAPKTLTKEQWAKIPAEFNFAAADSDGEWYAFITEPNRRTSCWKAKDEPYHGFKPGDVGTLPNAPWEDSLCKRPE